MTDLARDDIPATVSDEQLAEWEDLASAATEGPWVADGNGVHRGHECIGLTYHDNRKANAQFIALARTAIPMLVRALRDARADVDQLQRIDWQQEQDLAAAETERDSLRVENERLRDHVAALQDQDERNLAEIVALGDRIEAAEAIAREYACDHDGFDAVLAALAAPTGQDECSCAHDDAETSTHDCIARGHRDFVCVNCGRTRQEETK